MPSTVVLLSFLFLPALSEDLGKESCGRKVEPVRSMSESSKREGGPDQGVPSVPSTPPPLPEMLQDRAGLGARHSPERHQQLPNSHAV